MVNCQYSASLFKFTHKNFLQIRGGKKLYVTAKEVNFSVI